MFKNNKRHQDEDLTLDRGSREAIVISSESEASTEDDNKAIYLQIKPSINLRENQN